MRTLRTLLALSAVVMALSITSVSAQSFTGNPQATAQTIEKQAFKKLNNLPYYGVFDYITVSVNGDTVTLAGKVDSIGTRNQAVSVVKDLPGVAHVINNIEQLPASGFDDRIRRQALRSFTSVGPARYFSEIRPEVRIIVENGRLTLEGFVSNSGDYNTLNILANGVSGVFKVTNNLIVGKDVRR